MGLEARRAAPSLDPRTVVAREGARVAVVRLGALGDVLRTSPAVLALRRARPGLHLSWIVDDRWAPLLQGQWGLDEVLPLPRRRWEALLGAPSQWWRLVREIGDWLARLRERGFDLALDFHGTLRSGIVTRATGAPVRVGFAGRQQKEANWLWTTHRVVVAGGRRLGRVERNLRLLRALGIPAALAPGPVLEPDRARSEEAAVRARALSAGRPYAVLAPGASARQRYKRPPAALLAAAATALQRSGVVPLVFYGPGEETAAQAVVEASAGLARLAPPTDLPELAAWLARARIFVGGDSGPLHLACAVGCPVVGLYGPTDPVINEPWGVPHRVVAPPRAHYTGLKRLDRRHGFAAISEASVHAAVESLLAQTATGT